MRFITLVACIVAGAAAQSSTAAAAAPSSTCLAQNILDTCLGSTTARVQACGDLDWQCKCANQDAVITCYGNCPNDPGVTTAQGLKTQYCVAASQVAPSSTSMVSSMTSSLSTTAAGTGTTTSSTESTATAKSTNAAMAMYGSGSGIVAAVIGAAALL